jgi:hypothetical protein
MVAEITLSFNLTVIILIRMNDIAEGLALLNDVWRVRSRFDAI